MRRSRIYILLAVLLVPLAIVGWWTFGPGTRFEQKSKYLYLHSGQLNMEQLVQQLIDSQCISSPRLFGVLAGNAQLAQKLKPGRYEIKRGTSVFAIVRMFKNNVQAPVKLVITKLRTRRQLEAFLGKRFEADSAAFALFLNQPDSLKPYGLDTNDYMTAIFPDTYEVSWSASPSAVFRKLFNEQKRYWNEERTAKAKALGLDPKSVYILASIVEEETIAASEKDTIASVYLNRLRKGMKLQADPTVKYALQDFSLKRIYEKHLLVASPYNTYHVKGLPPGPICTPSRETLEAVLNTATTDYLYFVAKSDFSGRHVFSATYEEHMIKAKAFQRAQDEQQRIKKAAAAEAAAQ